MKSPEPTLAAEPESLNMGELADPAGPGAMLPVVARDRTLAAAVDARRRVAAARRSFQNFCGSADTGLPILLSVVTGVLVALGAFPYGLGMLIGVGAAGVLMFIGVGIGLCRGIRILRAQAAMRESVRLVARSDARELIAAMGEPANEDDREVLRVAMQALDRHRTEVVPAPPPPGGDREIAAASEPASPPRLAPTRPAAPASRSRPARG